MEKEHGKNNAQSLFGVHLIPSANQLRNLLDPVPAETLSQPTRIGSDENLAYKPK
jgi:hypothetical protein